MSSIDFSRDGRWMMLAGESGIEIRDRATGAMRTLDEREARCAFFLHDAGLVAAVLSTRLVVWPWESKTGEAGEPRVIWPGSWTLWAAPAPDGRGIIVSDSDGVKHVDPLAGQSRLVASAHKGIERPAMSPNGRWLFTGTWRGDGGRLFDIQANEAVLTVEESSVRGSISPDGNHVAIGVPGSFKLFKTDAWHAPRVLQWEPADVPLAGASAFSPDGKLLATVIAPHTVRLVDVATGEALARLPNPERLGVSELRFTPDSKSLAVVTIEREVLMWDLEGLRRDLRANGFDW
jgi:WD40 repeat protein